MNETLVKEVIKTRSRSLIVIAVLLLANAGLYVYLSFYQRPQLAAEQSRMFAARKAKNTGISKDATAVYQTGIADLETWNKRITAKKEFARVIGNLMDNARHNSLAVKGVTYKPSPVKGERLLIYSISFDVAGKYAGVKSFIADVSRMHDIIVIDNISLNNSKMTEEYVDLRLELSAYFRMEG